jgi:hypothetical protein
MLLKYPWSHCTMNGLQDSTPNFGMIDLLKYSWSHCTMNGLQDSTPNFGMID